MTFRHTALVGLLATLAVGIGGFVFGVGPPPGLFGGVDDETAIEEFPTESTADAPGTTGTTEPRPAFASRIERIESCGVTCREVTATVANVGNASAEDVVVYTRIYVGDDTDGDVVWEGRLSVGTLTVREAYTATQRVTLSAEEALAVQRADGQLTILTTVQSNDTTVTFTEHEDVT